MLVTEDRLKTELDNAYHRVAILRLKRARAKTHRELHHYGKLMNEAMDEVWRIEGEIERRNRRDSDF